MLLSLFSRVAADVPFPVNSAQESPIPIDNLDKLASSGIFRERLGASLQKVAGLPAQLTQQVRAFDKSFPPAGVGLALPTTTAAEISEKQG